MASQPTPIFIQACENKVYGDKIWVNANHIVNFCKDKQYSNAEGLWYKLILSNGKICYTLYNLQLFNVYTLPDY